MEAAPPSHVYLFATCIIDMFSPRAGLDVVELIERAGVRVVFRPGQSCCGQPAYTSGFLDEARKVAAAQLDLFPEPWPIVVPSGSCGGMLRHHYPRLFGDDPQRLQQAKAIAERVVEFTDFVGGGAGPGDRGIHGLDFAASDRRPIKVALHTSCSARREMNTLHAGRELLRRLPGVVLVEHSHEAECCGFGGTFAVKHPEISAAMAQDKIKALEASGCDVLVSADCGCLMNLNCTLERRRSALRGEHIATFVRSRLGRSS